MSGTSVFPSNFVSLSRFGRSLTIGTRGSPGVSSSYATQASRNFGRQIDDPGELAQWLRDFIDELAALRDFLAGNGLLSLPNPVTNEELVHLIMGLLQAGGIWAHSAPAASSAPKTEKATDRLLDQVLHRSKYFAGDPAKCDLAADPCTSTGWCAKYVAAAIHAGGVGNTITFPKSAYMFGNYTDKDGSPHKGKLLEAGFVTIDAAQPPKPGDVLVLSNNIPNTATDVSQNGHIAMCYGSLSAAIWVAKSAGIDLAYVAHHVHGFQLTAMDPLWIADFVQGGRWGLNLTTGASFGSQPSRFRNEYSAFYRHPALS